MSCTVFPPAVPCEDYGYNMDTIDDQVQVLYNINTVAECQYHCQQHSSCNFFKYHYPSLGGENARKCGLYSAHPGKHGRDHISIGPKYC